MSGMWDRDPFYDNGTTIIFGPNVPFFLVRFFRYKPRSMVIAILHCMATIPACLPHPHESALKGAPSIPKVRPGSLRLRQELPLWG